MWNSLIQFNNQIQSLAGPAFCFLCPYTSSPEARPLASSEKSRTVKFKGYQHVNEAKILIECFTILQDDCQFNTTDTISYSFPLS